LRERLRARIDSERRGFVTHPVPPFLLVSDFDDTLKISHTTNRLRTVFRGLFAKQGYVGMSELYQEWVGEGPFVVLSSSPQTIRGKIDRFLTRHEYPAREIWLRDWMRQKDIRRYKNDSLRKLENRPEPGFIFVGDDAEYDPEVFEAFRERNPERTLGIYIRRVRGRPLPESAVPFHTAFEIALAELARGRLKIPQVARIGKAIMEHTDPDLLIPYFVASPIEVAVVGEMTSLTRIIDGVNLLYERIRKERSGK
jgi:phosphatidate phosphatase APP1